MTIQKTAFIIPTYDRINSLKETIKCINKIKYFTNIFIVLDGNDIDFELAENFIITKNEIRKDWPFSINRILKEIESEIYVPFADDILFNSNDFENAINYYYEKFPNEDGALGLNQDLLSFGMGAFTIIGNEYVNHFPDRQVYCPDYIHYYSDQEHYLYSKSIGKYEFFKDIKLHHIDRTPNGGFKYKDTTNKLAHSVIMRDKKIFQERQRKGYLWGKDFNLITK